MGVLHWHRYSKSPTCASSSVPPMQINDECNSRYDDVELTLDQANQQWSDLEERLHDVEERFLIKRASDWKKWFSIDETDLDNFNEDGLRCHIRWRIEALLFRATLER